MLGFLKTAPSQAILGRKSGMEESGAPINNARNRNAEDALAAAHAMLDFVGDAVIGTDTDTRITYMNHTAETLTGFSSENAMGQPLEAVFRVMDMVSREKRDDLARQVMDTGHSVPLHNSAFLITPDGREFAIEDAAAPRYNSGGDVIGAMVKFHDARYSAETTARMAYLAQHDPLTGALNRHAFAERFDHAAALARRHHTKMVLLFIDLDHFKEVNDTLGHRRGDAVLKALYRKLRHCVRATDHVCRHGGDEFVVLLSDFEQQEQAFAVIEKVRGASVNLLRLGGLGRAVGFSIGMSIYPDNGETLEALLSHADGAMYRAKSALSSDGDQRSEGRSEAYGHRT
jgi:diguanylate cyclase (GGDEF)-like protein/PAS domain S-box-containing protein